MKKANLPIDPIIIIILTILFGILIYFFITHSISSGQRESLSFINNFL